MSFIADMVEAEVSRRAEPAFSIEIANALRDQLEPGQVYSALKELTAGGRIHRIERMQLPSELRSKGSPREAWTYLATAPAATAPAAPVSTDAELAKLLRQRVEAAEDAHDPEAALDPPINAARAEIPPPHYNPQDVAFNDPICRAIDRLPRLHGTDADALRLYKIADWIAPRGDKQTQEINARRDVAAYLCELAAKLEVAA